MRLTKELERVTEQIKVYEVQITAQSEKKERAKNTSSEVRTTLLNIKNTGANTSTHGRTFKTCICRHLICGLSPPKSLTRNTRQNEYKMEITH